MLFYFRHHAWVGLLVFAVTATSGCASKPSIGPTTVPGGLRVDSVLANCYPPSGWLAEPLKKSDRHAHQIWISPSGNTAYGVAHFSLPLPLSDDLVLWIFLREMKRTEGEATLISKEFAPDLPGLRFEAVGGLYHVRGHLLLDGRQGWVVYAATSKGRTEDVKELDKAISARNETNLLQP